jgi:hypothetical protein
VVALDVLIFSRLFCAITATLTSKGQIIIPIHVRNRLHLKPDDDPEFDEATCFSKLQKPFRPRPGRNSDLRPPTLGQTTDRSLIA